MNPIRKAQDLLAQAENIVILAGAGMSADLGVPVYYGGTDTKYGSNLSPYGYTAFEHAHASLWFSDTKSQLDYCRDNWKFLLSTKPEVDTSPYKILLNWIKATSKEYFVATSNVDSAFIRSGYNEETLYEVHGSYRYSQCLTSSYHGIYPTVNPEKGLTFCPRCISHSRPNMLHFDDFSFNDDYTLEQQDKFVRFIQQKKEAGSATVIIEIGAGETVSTLRNFSQDLSMYHKFPVIRLNPDEDTVAFRTKGRAGRPNGEFIHIKEKATAGLNSLFSITAQELNDNR